MRLMPLLTALLFVFSACDDKDPVMLVHGAHFSSASWDTLRSELEARGFDTFAVDLPGRDGVAAGVTLVSSAQALCDALEDIGEKTTVVAHSQGGAIANQAVNICADLIKKIVYVSAVVPVPGEHPFDGLGGQVEDFAGPALTFDAMSGLLNITDNDLFLEGFAQDITDMTLQDAILADARSEPAAIAFAGVLDFDQATFDAIPKAYIMCAVDRIVQPASQVGFITRSNIDVVRILDSSHLVMVKLPEELAEALDSAISEL